MSSQQAQYVQSTQKPGKSVSEVFWLRIMHEIIRPRFLKVKENQQGKCMLMPTFHQFYSCYNYQNDCLQKDTLEMEFFANKFDTCIKQGHKALYPPARVEDICSNKIINIIKEQTKIRRQRQKQTKLSTAETEAVEQKNDEKQKIQKMLTLGNRKLSYQEQISIRKSTLF